MQAEWDDGKSRAVAFDLADLEIESVRDPARASLVGRTIGEIAEEEKKSKLDALLDLALAEDLETNFRTRTSEIGRQFIAHVVESGVANPIVMAGSSDGGAHLASFTGADYSTRLLTEWVPGTLSMEQAIWRLSGMPATVHGLRDRGFLRTGAFADVVVFDPARLVCGEAHLVRDFPAGTERYVVEAEGYVATVVNGEIVIRDDAHTGALPGHVLRGC